MQRRELIAGVLAAGVAVAAAMREGSRSAAAYRPDRSTAGHLAGLVHSLREEDDTAPTGSLLPVSERLVSLAEQFTTDAKFRDQREIGRAAAEAAMLHWWLTADAGLDADAARHRAVDFAVEWDMPEIVGHMFGWRSGLALADGHLHAAVKLARRAREPQWRLSPGSVGWSSNYEVRAQALLGDADGLKLALDVSQEAHDNVVLANEPPWMYWLEDMLEPNKLDLRLLRHGPDAAQPLEDVLARYPAGRDRDVAWYRAHIASARAWADDIEGAAQDAEEAARLTAATGTNWTMGEIRQLSAQPHLSRLREVLADVH